MTEPKSLIERLENEGQKSDAAPVDKTLFLDAAAHIKEQDLWLDNADSRMAEMEIKISRLSALIEEVKNKCLTP